jgi:hypothetical protein
MPIKSKSYYVQELSDLMVDLQDAIENKNEEKISKILEISRCILEDIEDASYEGYYR